MKKFILFCLIVFLPVISFARFEKLVGEIDELLAPVKGYVVSVDNNIVYTDLGRKNAYKGRIFEVFREGQKIIHPITGEVLGVKRTYLGKIRISDVFDKYSIAEIIEKKGNIKKGDTVIGEVPVKVKVEFNNFDRRLELLLREDLAKANNFVLDKNGNEYKLIFWQDNKGGITYKLFAGKELVAEKYYADINESFLVGGKSRLQMVDLLSSGLIKKEYRVMTVGDVIGDKYDYIVAATEDSVDIYKFDGEKFVYVDKLKGDFNEIISVEAIDLNDNGVDEIFISNLSGAGSLKSMIYEYTGKRFQLVKKSIPFIFRTVSINGKKKLVCQRLSRDGLFLGAIYFYDYKNDYMKSEKIDYTEGVGIYGFGYADIDSDKENEVLFINDYYHLEVFKKGKKIYESPEYFNETPYYFTLKKEIQEGSNIMQNKMDLDDIIKYKKYFKGRLFVDEDGKLYILKNKPIARFLPNFKVYTDSSMASYKFEVNRLRKLWESDTFRPVIVDYFVMHKYGKDYVILLRSEQGGLFESNKSEFIYLEIK